MHLKGETDIYNPWSIIYFLSEGKVGAYWANTSANSLVGKLSREGSCDVKKTFEHLMQGESIRIEIDEQIVYEQLNDNEQAIWSLLLASGYLKVNSFASYMTDFGDWKQEYELELTNFEVRVMFRSMVRKWFSGAGGIAADRREELSGVLGGKRDSGREYQEVWVCFLREKSVDWRDQITL